MSGRGSRRRSHSQASACYVTESRSRLGERDSLRLCGGARSSHPVPPLVAGTPVRWLGVAYASAVTACRCRRVLCAVSVIRCAKVSSLPFGSYLHSLLAFGVGAFGRRPRSPFGNVERGDGSAGDDVDRGFDAAGEADAVRADQAVLGVDYVHVLTR